MSDSLSYLTGFGNALTSEAVPGVVPARANGPRVLPHGLHAEQINGTGFTLPRALNRRIWLYRLRPQVPDRKWVEVDAGRWVSRFDDLPSDPQIHRFRPAVPASGGVDFISGVSTFAGAGDPAMKSGMAIHRFAADADMVDTAFTNIDGDLLVAPWEGRLRIRTEMGWLEVGMGELALLPRGIRFQVFLPDGPVRGYIAEVYEGHFELPQRGPVGANGLADERHFKAPVASYEDREAAYTLTVKQAGRFWQVPADHSPFDVVGWHGNYLPFKYDLRDFNSFGSVSRDHPDPSILTVLTVPGPHGRSSLDVAVFLGRWDVTEDTFRPPFFHRNSAIEFNMVMANDTPSSPWAAGVHSWTPYLSPHGVSAQTVEKVQSLTPEQANTPQRGSDEEIWLQFESTYLLKVTPWATDDTIAPEDQDYLSSFSHYPAGQVK